MTQAVFASGVPMRIDAAYFRARYGDKFSALLDDEKDSFLNSVIDDMYTMFSGVQTIWQPEASDSWYSKTRLCFGLLTAWYITDMFPEYADGVVSTGGMPVKSKAIDGVKIMFEDVPKLMETSALNVLRSNPFGVKAYAMIRGAVSTLKIFVRR